MKRYNSPSQARSLREIEASMASPMPEIIRDTNGHIQSVSTEAPGKEKEEAGAEVKAETPTKKARKKKDTEAV